MKTNVVPYLSSNNAEAAMIMRVIDDLLFSPNNIVVEQYSSF